LRNDRAVQWRVLRARQRNHSWQPRTMTPTPTPRPAPQGEALRWTGATLIFIAEVVTLLAFAWWGFAALHGPIQWVVGLGLPVGTAVLWGFALAPRARFSWPTIPRIAVRTVILLAGGAALLAVGATALGWIEIVFVIAGTALTWGWEPPRHPEPVVPVVPDAPDAPAATPPAP
jgi:hypothetical protein